MKTSGPTKVFRLNAQKRKGLGLLLQGTPVAEVGRAVGRSDRQVRNWRREFQELFLCGNEEWLELVSRLVGKALEVYEKYLDGKGEEIGGDIMTHGGVELFEQMIDLAEKAGVHKFDEKEIDLSFLMALGVGEPDFEDIETRRNYQAIKFH